VYEPTIQSIGYATQLVNLFVFVGDTQGGIYQEAFVIDTNHELYQEIEYGGIGSGGPTYVNFSTRDE
jgi:hypothetical protein